jgi:wobble nucleotide-excising tRNase
LFDLDRQLENHPLIRERLADFQSRHRKLTGTLEKNLANMSTKVASPSQGVTLLSSTEAVAELNDFISEINATVGQHNKRLDNRDTTLDELKREFWSAMRWDYDQTISRHAADNESAARQIAAVDQEIRSLQERKRQVSSEIADLQRSTVNIAGAVANINARLEDLGIDAFRIETLSESQYRIAREGEQAGDFKSLSEGEKMIISFLYFCELCKGRREATDTSTNKIVVIDDPISSLSHIFVFNMGQMIKQELFCSDQFQQVFVLTHSLYFFYELAERNHERRHNTQKLFRLTKDASGSQISSMKYEEIQNDYQAYWSIVNDRNHPPALIANAMRNIVEHFFGFVGNLHFQDVFNIPALGSNRYQAFKRFIDRESHSEGQNLLDYKEFDYDVFLEGLKLVFVQQNYEAHFEKMRKIGKWEPP